MPTPEGKLVSGVLTYLRIRQIVAWRNNTGALRNQHGRPVAFGTKGSGDIFALLPPGGRFVSIECKQPGRYPTKVQKAFMAMINGQGGMAFVARSIDDVIVALEEAGASGTHPTG